MTGVGAIASSYATGPGAWSPLDLPWAHAYWAEGPEFLALGLSDGNNVTTWPDEIGTNNFAAPVGREPVYDINDLGGQPAVKAVTGGSGDRLNAAFSSSISAPYSLVVIHRKDSGGNNACIVDNSSGGPAALYYGSGPLSLEAGVLLVRSPSFTTGNALVVGFVNSTTSDAIEINGGVTNGSAGNNACLGFTLFQLRSDHVTGPLYGPIAFVAIATGDIRTDPGWATFESWVTSHYGITIA